MRDLCSVQLFLFTKLLYEKHCAFREKCCAFREKRRFSKDNLQGIVTVCFLVSRRRAIVMFPLQGAILEYFGTPTAQTAAVLITGIFACGLVYYFKS